ncbi:hypothetical protein B0H67DRAFT_583237 [Lasiosphaeris hirsuta]|uniref:C2H2-type domain-containing protein n=1 Tax=Lasiosphaeris hirsuta TaxID=260670 RepID=A0AA40A7E8_9PEZI|nr:hypothetical protein B0H67DRAFT_583237 [Lasiosphaeris hirsuta]
MSFHRLRQKGRIEPASKIPSPKPIKPATEPPLPDPASLQSQHTDQINAASSMLLFPTVNGPQWPKRLFQTICPSTTRDADMVSCDVDGKLGRGVEPPLRTAITRHAQQSDLKLEGWPTKRGTSNRQPQRPTVESGSDTARARRRARQSTSPAVHLGAKTQHSPFLQPVCSSSDDTKKPLFACPFYKLDPDTYRDCRRFELSRVKDVKQHLQRKHSPPSYCNRCYKVFGTKESLADHQRGDDPCERRDGPLPGSISEQQWQKLSQQYQSRGKPVEEQWRDFWRILFPGRDPPRSVYLDNELAETISRMRAFWSIKKEDITRRTVRETGANATRLNTDDPGCFVHLFGRFLEDFLGQFEAETASSSSVGAATPPDSMVGSPYVHNPTWEDTASVASTVVDPYFIMESGSVLSNNGHLLGVEVRTPSPWGSQQLLAPFSRNFSASVSTDSFSNFYGSEQLQYDSLMEGASDQGYWMQPCDEAPVQMCGQLLGNPMVLISSQPAPPQHRYTWPLPSTETWY